MAMTEEALVAEGWTRLPTKFFSTAIGSSWLRGEPGARTVGLVTDERQANDHMGIIHGGAMMTFADMAMGCAVADELSGTHCATAQLQYHFAGATRPGEFITCQPEIVRRTSQMVFVRGLVKADGRTVGAVDAIFKVLDQGKFDAIKAG